MKSNTFNSRVRFQISNFEASPLKKNLQIFLANRFKPLNFKVRRSFEVLSKELKNLLLKDSSRRTSSERAILLPRPFKEATDLGRSLTFRCFFEFFKFNSFACIPLKGSSSRLLALIKLAKQKHQVVELSDP